MPSFRGLLNRTVILSRPVMTGETGGGQGIYEPTEVGLLRARIELVGLGGRSLAPTEQRVDNEAVVAEFHGLADLRLEGPSPREPANLTEKDELIDPIEGAVYELLTVATADGRRGPHHYELKLRKVTP